MKRILSILSCALALTTVVSCDWFELDNQDGWDAKVKGRILDSKTNQPVQSEQGAGITIIEQGWTDPATGNPVSQNQSWLIKNDGTYCNNLVFAGDYIMNTTNANFMADPASFKLSKGENTVDFTVTPYCRIVNPVVSYNSATKEITATFSIEAGVSQVNNIGNVYLCVYPDRFVRNAYNNCKEDPYAHAVNVNPDGVTKVTLSVDPNRIVKKGNQDVYVNAEEFQYDRPHYIRIAAIGAHYSIVPEWEEWVTTDEFDMDAYTAAGMPSDWWNYFKQVKVVHPAEYANDGSINVNNAYNYSPVYKLENGTITEVTDW